MEKYIEIVTQLYPTWLDGGVVQICFPFFPFVSFLTVFVWTVHGDLSLLSLSLVAYQKAGSRSKDEAVSNSGGTMGPVFSSLVYEGESENEL